MSDADANADGDGDVDGDVDGTWSATERTPVAGEWTALAGEWTAGEWTDREGSGHVAAVGTRGGAGASAAVGAGRTPEVTPQREFEQREFEQRASGQRESREWESGGRESDDGAVRANFAELAQAEVTGGSQPDIGGLDEKTLQPLLLHSLAELREVWLPVLEAAGVRSVAEIGSESGMTTKLLVDTLRRGGGGRLLVIDPDPGVVPSSGRGLQVEVIRGYSPEALEGHAPTDAYLIDGDHNYYTVSCELAAIQEAVDEFGVSYFPLVVLHDVGWPAGRRDQYYSPDRVPAWARQPYSWDVGVKVEQVDAGRGGFRGEGAFAWALTEGGPGNGVRTAVEDFVAERPDLRLFTVIPIFGLGVIVDRRAPWARRVAALLEPWVNNGLVARMERNRVDLYLKVLALQDELVDAARQRQRDWSRLDAERSQDAALELQRLSRIADLEQELATGRRDAEQARAELADEPKLVHVARLANAALKERLNRSAAAASALPGAQPGAGDTKALSPGPAQPSAVPSPGAAVPPRAASRRGIPSGAGGRGLLPALLPALRSARRAIPRR